MGSFVKIGSFFIDLSKYDHQDTHNCEPFSVGYFLMRRERLLAVMITSLLFVLVVFGRSNK
ncbi:transmembrane protein, putative [Medicago truncatula]|uniref:Transmembrane protein, putative n=1 Tax=Medicago truncatula TaxID=3880 RepID=G7IB35_MEDTR|nr:transmembrane protein, putative [Medicago truncatula]